MDASPAVKENPDFVGGSVKWSGVSRFIESIVRSLVGFVHESKKIKKIMIEKKNKRINLLSRIKGIWVFESKSKRHGRDRQTHLCSG